MLLSAGTSPTSLSRHELSMDRASSAGGIGVSVRAGSGGHKDTRGDVSLVSGLAVGRRSGEAGESGMRMSP